MIAPPTCSPRSGNALVLTMIVVTVLASMLALSSERVMGMNKMTGFNLRNQQVTYAAEAGASLVEGCIYASSGNNESLTTDIMNTANTVQSPATWLNYMGYVGPTGQQASSYAASFALGGLPNLWIGNCVVQWRIEPVTVFSTTYTCSNLAPFGSSSNYAPPSSQYLYNYQANPSLQGVPPFGALTNTGFYHYRIIATAYYMQDLPTATAQLGLSAPLTIANVTPWSQPQEALAVAQVERYVEIKLINLFQYVIFYAATGPTGDIEFHPGPPLTINGAVQSNGAIYCGGANTPYTTGDYHSAANEGGQLNIGNSSSPVAITGYDGIFRMRKAGNTWFAQTFNCPAALSPGSIPFTGGSLGGQVMSGPLDLNGDTPGSTVIQLNGINTAPIPPTPNGIVPNPLFAGATSNDSRGNLAIDSANNWSYIKDKNHGATKVQTLSNFPQLAGYPFEYQQIVPPAVNSAPSPLYDSGPGTHYLTINPSQYPGAAVPVFYNTTYGTPLTTTPAAATPIPVVGSDMPLFWMKNTASGTWFADIWPAQPTTHQDFAVHAAAGAGNSYSAGNVWPTLNMGNTYHNGTGTGYNTGYMPMSFPPNGYTPNIFDTYLPVSYPTLPTPVLGSAVEGYFLNESLRGQKGSTKTGLTIRERGTPNLNFKWYTQNDIINNLAPHGTLVMAPAATALPGSTTFPAFGLGSFPFLWNQCPGTLTLTPVPAPGNNLEIANAYIAMMEASYAVYLGVAPVTDANGTTYLQPYDITAAFFLYGQANVQASGLPLNTANQSLGLIATQDLFRNWREASWMEVNHYLTSAEAPNYYIDALTVNIGLVCSFLQNTTWNNVDPTGQTGYWNLLSIIPALSSTFNGIIYVQRTPRAAWWSPSLPASYPTFIVGYPYYDPLSPLGYNPSFTATNSSTLSPYLGPFACSVEGANNGSSYPVVGASLGLTVGAMPAMAPGQSDIWSVYPSPKAVRVSNGATINWGGVQPAAGNRPQGLTVITPDPCYMWGDYNINPVTALGVSYVTPCAVYCDELSDLSSSWVDNVGTYAGGEPSTGVATSYVCSVVINNLPTDSENTYCGGSNGTHNVIRYCENWGTTWTFNGSLVVLNRMRYTRSYQTTPTPPITTLCPLSAGGSFYATNRSGGYYSPPTRVYQFNSDLLTSAGTPPAGLNGISVQRVVSTVNLINK